MSRRYCIAVNWAARAWDVTNRDGYTVATFASWRAARRYARQCNTEATS